MKAYGIKNKDLYKTTNSRLWTKDISKCAKWDTFAKANQYLKGCYLNNIEDCEVVEITITEEDLEQANKILRDALYHKEELISELDDYFEGIFNQLNPNWVEEWGGAGMKVYYQKCIETIKKLQEVGYDK